MFYMCIVSSILQNAMDGHNWNSSESSDRIVILALLFQMLEWLLDELWNIDLTNLVAAELC